MDLKSLCDKFADYQVKQRRWFHQNPEVSTKEFETSTHIKAELDRMGIAWRNCGLQTGVVAKIQGCRPGKTILLRADMDALSVNEETGEIFSSRNPGVMHACGHDCHMSMLLTAAAMLNELKADFDGTVVLAFQPAEEMGVGAKSMIEEGVLDGVDAAFSMHVWSDLQAGTISVREGAAMASGDRFSIDVEGVGGHGAMPHVCTDAAVICSAIVQNLQTVVSREISPVETAVVTVGTIEAGTRWNVVAGSGRLTGTTRCFSNEVREHFPEMIGRIATQTASALKGKARLTYDALVPPVINDQGMARLVQSCAREVLGEKACVDYPLTMVAEDFAYFEQKVPGVMALFGILNEACGAVYPQHSGCYRVDESMLIHGAELYAKVALSFLKA